MIPTAFSALRLSGQLVSATPDSRLSVNGVKTMSVNDSGAFTSSAVVQNTGQALYGYIVGLSGSSNATFATQTTTNTLTTNLTSTGVQLAATAAATYATLTNVTSTGVQLGASITSLSGWATAVFLQKGSDLSYTTGLATGSDSFNVLLPTGFAGKPRILCDMEVSGGFAYAHNVGLVTSSGFQLYLSDVIAEPGVIAHISARY